MRSYLEGDRRWRKEEKLAKEEGDDDDEKRGSRGQGGQIGEEEKEKEADGKLDRRGERSVIVGAGGREIRDVDSGKGDRRERG